MKEKECEERNIHDHIIFFYIDFRVNLRVS